MRLASTAYEKVWGSPHTEPWHRNPDGRAIGEVWFSPSDSIRLLVKFLFTMDNLSVQVHPRGEAGVGKTEMWHILRAQPERRIGVGLREASHSGAFAPELSERRIIVDMLELDCRSGRARRSSRRQERSTPSAADSRCARFSSLSTSLIACTTMAGRAASCISSRESLYRSTPAHIAATREIRSKNARAAGPVRLLPDRAHDIVGIASCSRIAKIRDLCRACRKAKARSRECRSAAEKPSKYRPDEEAVL